MLDPRDMACAIKKLRGNRTQSALAKGVGVSSSTWCKWEQGGTMPQRVSLSKIAKALGCTVERLQEVAWECHRERIAPQEPEPANLQVQLPGDPHSSYLVQMLRDIDAQLNSLLESKRTLLRILERLVIPIGELPSGG